MGLSCTNEERGETPGREDSPSDLVEAELDAGGDAKNREDKAFGTSRTVEALNSRDASLTSGITFKYLHTKLNKTNTERVKLHVSDSTHTDTVTHI